ncbi:hypothetical protein NX059_009234 [Plenodomus lindquistii]|nr:hypothetical protein NX059_009234 [Plenodomus lindquistii]
MSSEGCDVDAPSTIEGKLGVIEYKIMLLSNAMHYWGDKHSNGEGADNMSLGLDLVLELLAQAEDAFELEYEAPSVTWQLQKLFEVALHARAHVR